MRVASIRVVGLALLLPAALASQTLVQLTDMGSGMGPRLTAQVARTQFGRTLFANIGTKVEFIDNGTPYQLITDPTWGRVVFAKKDAWIRRWTGTSGSTLSTPLGIDISARRVTYIAERGRGRVLVNATDLPNAAFTSSQVLNTGGHPIDVAWDGWSAPLTTDYLYVLDDSTSRVTYWNMNGTIPTAPVWSFGTRGSGTGQFMRPSGICVGKSPTYTGGTAFTNVFYVVDRGNGRVVAMYRYGSGASVSTAMTQPGWDPKDCTVDHFGNVYISDNKNSRIYKFDANLRLLDSYGTYGTGASNIGTLDHPGSVSVPCGLKLSGSQTVWYCEGRLLTAERWSDSTGAVEHYLGINASFTGSPWLDGYGSAVVGYRFTDAAYISVTIQRVGYGQVRTLMTNLLISPGEWSTGWDGHMDDGSIAPTDDYIFRVYMKSAYGCPNNFHQQWCEPMLYSTAFHYQYCVPAGGGGGGGGPLAPQVQLGLKLATQQPPPPPTCTGPTPTAGLHDINLGTPTRFAIRQLPDPGGSIPAGVSAFGSGGGSSPAMTAAGDPIESDASAAAAVRSSGLMAVQVNAPSAGALRVEIYSLDGRRIYSSTSDLSGAGVYAFRWDGLLESGSQASPGVYLVTVSHNGETQQTRLVKVRP